jgi:hypothetical protein
MKKILLLLILTFVFQTKLFSQSSDKVNFIDGVLTPENKNIFIRYYTHLYINFTKEEELKYNIIIQDIKKITSSSQEFKYELWSQLEKLNKDRKDIISNNTNNYASLLNEFNSVDKKLANECSIYKSNFNQESNECSNMRNAGVNYTNQIKKAQQDYIYNRDSIILTDSQINKIRFSYKNLSSIILNATNEFEKNFKVINNVNLAHISKEKEKQAQIERKKIEEQKTQEDIYFILKSVLTLIAVVLIGIALFKIKKKNEEKARQQFLDEEKRIDDLFKINQGSALISAIEFYSKHKLEYKFLEKYGDLHPKITKFCEKIIEENNKENINLYKKVLENIKELNDFMEQADKKAESFVKKYPYLKSLLKRV